MSIRIMISDDHPATTTGLRVMLEEEQFNICGVFNSPQKLLDELAVNQPDVLLLDVMQPGFHGKDLATTVKTQYPNVKILVLTGIESPAMVSTMMRRGCSGYVLKGAEKQTLAEAIKTIYSGAEYIEPSLKERLIENLIGFSKKGADEVPRLTQREMQILQLIVDENTTQEIANKLFISVKTAENHRNNILHKLDVKNTVGLVKVAIKLGLVK